MQQHLSDSSPGNPNTLRQDLGVLQNIMVAIGQLAWLIVCFYYKVGGDKNMKSLVLLRHWASSHLRIT